MKIRLFSLFLVVCLFLSACQPAFRSSQTEQSFSAFTDELFLSYAASDSLTLNYTLRSPENYGISELPDGLSSFSLSDLKKGIYATENTIARLSEYEKEEMSFSDRLLYDTLAYTLETDRQEFSFLTDLPFFDPTSGIQAQLPVLLSEFYLDDKSDVEQYFCLLKSLPSYFKSLLSLEKERNSAGTGSSRHTLKQVLAGCQEFLSGGTGSIQKNFREKIADLSTLSSEEKQEAVSLHKTYMKTYVISAYQTLIRGLKKLVKKAPADGSLAAFPDGKEYYAFLLRKKAGTSLSPTALETALTQTLDEAEQTLLSTAAKNPAALSSSESALLSHTDAASILKTLRSQITSDFPAIKAQTCHIRSVDSSLENYLSPAFYLTPPIDEKTAQVIYINRAEKYRRSGLFNTLAHEGYPGHLYQNCYMREKNLPELRYVLDFPGYTEGYATYAEIYSYRYLDASEDEIAILQNNAIASLCLYTLADIGIHYRHWNTTQLSSFLQSHGVYGDDSAQTMYDLIIDSPGSYLPYTVGYLEITRLKSKFQKAAGDAYSELLFHRYLLDLGATSYKVLETYMSEWLAKEK